MNVNLEIQPAWSGALCGAASGGQEVGQVNLWFQQGRTEKLAMEVNLEIRCCLLGALCGPASDQQEALDQVNLRPRQGRTEK